MAKVTVEKRQFENDQGNIIPYNVIVIRGVLNGKEEKIEKSVSRTEAMLMGMLLESDEDTHKVEVRRANSNEQPQVSKQKSILDEIEEDSGMFN